MTAGRIATLVVFTMVLFAIRTVVVTQAGLWPGTLILLLGCALGGAVYLLLERLVS